MDLMDHQVRIGQAVEAVFADNCDDAFTLLYFSWLTSTRDPA